MSWEEDLAIIDDPTLGDRYDSFWRYEIRQFFGGCKSSEFVVFHGSRACHTLSEPLCVRSHLPCAEGGLKPSVVYIDGGNIFDPHFISETARQIELEYRRGFEKDLNFKSLYKLPTNCLNHHRTP